MSRLWMWRSGNDRQGPLCTAQLRDLLRSRPGDEVAEVQVVGIAGWISARAIFAVDGDFPADDAAEAVAQLLFAAEQLRAAPPLDVAAELCSDGDSRLPSRRRHTPQVQASVTTLLLVAIFALLFHARRDALPTNSAAFDELQRLYQNITDMHRGRMSATTTAESPASVGMAIRNLAEQLEAAAESLPLLSLEHPDTDAADVLARRELLCAARDLERLLSSARPVPMLEAGFRQHMERAAACLGRAERHSEPLPGP